MKRGQAAIEYLIILAVVVIIALIVIGVIGGFPGMTRGISERDSAAYWTSADVGITRYFVSATANKTQLVVRNNRLFAINFTGISLDSGVNVLNYTTGVLIAPGSAVVVNLTVAGCPAATQSYSRNINMSYNDATYSVVYTFIGEKPLVGTCQT